MIGIIQNSLVRISRLLYKLADKMSDKGISGYKYDRESDITYAEGSTLIYTILKLNIIYVHHIILRNTLITESYYDDVIRLAEERGIETIYDKRKVLPKGGFFGFQTIAKIDKPSSTILPGNHIVLVEPSSFGNIGAILRSALAFGIKDIAII